MKVSSWFKQKMKALLIKVVRSYFKKEFWDLKIEQDQLNKDFQALLIRQQNVELAQREAKLGGVINPGGGSWLVLGYKVGDRPYVNFYDLNDFNMGAIRALVEKFEKGGYAVLVKSPFDRTPARGKG